MLAGGGSARAGWRMRVMLMGLFPVFTKASVLALVYGPKRKPTYKVTRKEDEFALYWRETMIQSGCVLALVASIIYSFTESPKHFTIDAGAIYWAFFFSLLLAGFVRKSWFGISLLPRRDKRTEARHMTRAVQVSARANGPRSRALRSSPVGPAAPAARPNPGPLRPGEEGEAPAARRQPDFLPVRHPLPDARARPRLVARSTWTSHFS